MIIRQLSVFLEDKQGKLSEVTHILAENNINISAFCVADSTDYGILRLVVEQPAKALEILRANHYSVHVTDVAGMTIAHEPGALDKALKILSENNVSIDYMYAFVSNTNSASVVIHSSDIPHLVQVLKANNI